MADLTPPSTADLVAAEGRGEALDPAFFWGHHPRADGELGPSCLSQCWPAAFVLDGAASRRRSTT